jgi:Shedu protein SduA, C-terminal
LIQRAHAGQLAQPSGEYHLISTEQMESVRTLLKFVRRADSAQRMRLVRALLENLDIASVEPEEWLQVFDAGSDGVRRVIAVSSRLAEYRRVRDQLAALIANPNVPESDLQRMLKKNPWLFGSEYSRLVSRRTWTRDDRLDFMLRRTADDYLEIIEIKTPLRQSLFRYDESHDSYAPGVPLSNVLGQVVRYIEEVERNRDSIIAKDACDPLKIRARVIIGRDGDECQQRALRNFNGHLHGIEVLTFDQLLRIADRVLSVFEDTLTKAAQ